MIILYEPLGCRLVPDGWLFYPSKGTKAPVDRTADEPFLDKEIAMTAEDKAAMEAATAATQVSKPKTEGAR